MAKLLLDRVGTSEEYSLPSGTFDLENIEYVDGNIAFTDHISKPHSNMWVLTYQLKVIPSDTHPNLSESDLRKIRDESDTNYDLIELVYVHPYRSSIADIKAIIPAIYQCFVVDETWCEFISSLCIMQPLDTMEFARRYGVAAIKPGKLNTSKLNIDYIHHDNPEDWIQYSQSNTIGK